MQKRRLLVVALAVLLTFACSACSTDPASEHPELYEASLVDTLTVRPRRLAAAIEKALTTSGYTVHRKSFNFGSETILVRGSDNPTWAGIAGYDPMGNERKRAIPRRTDEKSGFGVDPPQLFALVLVYPVEVAPNLVELKISTKAWKYFPNDGRQLRTRTDDTACRLLLREIRATLR
jgi:hypothetical protein